MSNRIGIDFRRRRSMSLLGGGLLLAGISAAVALGNLHRQTADLVTGWENAVSRVTRQSSPPSRHTASAVQELDLPHVQDILKRLNLPWEKLFAALEKAAGDDVALVSLKPDPDRGLVRIGGESRDLYAMLAYAKRLQDAGAFTEVTLMSHEIAAKPVDKPVQFQLQAKWKP